MKVSFCCHGQLAEWDTVGGLAGWEKVKGKGAGSEDKGQLSRVIFLLPILFLVSETVKLLKPGGAVMKHASRCKAALPASGSLLCAHARRWCLAGRDLDLYTARSCSECYDSFDVPSLKHLATNAPSNIFHSLEADSVELNPSVLRCHFRTMKCALATYFLTLCSFRWWINLCIHAGTYSSALPIDTAGITYSVSE